MNVFEIAYSDRPFLFGKNATEELMFVIDKFGIQGTALDLGCGDGRDTYHVLKKGLAVTAIDQSRSAIDRLISREDIGEIKNLKLSTICQDVNTLSLKEKEYDFVYAVTLFDHLTIEEGSILLKKVIRALKDYGYLFIKVHTVDDVGNTHASKEVSEFATEIKHFFSHEELFKWSSSYGRIMYYLEASELDLDHGAPHTHSFASILIRKEK